MPFVEQVTRRIYKSEQLSDPGVIKTIFSSPKMSLLFLPIRVYLGWQWLSAGIEKINSPGWTRSGTALQAFWVNATKGVPGAKGAAIHYGWYHDFLVYMLNQHWYTWFGKLIAFGETAMGIMLIIGAFVGIAAFFGAFMNFNFLLAGSASSNPVLFALAILLVLGWKVAGYVGADYFLLPAVGTPWKPGHVVDFSRRPNQRPAGMARKTVGAVGFLAAFAAAGAVAVLANNQWNEALVVGYLVALAAVVLAWVIGEAVLTATHSEQDRPVQAAPQLRTGPMA